MRSSIKILLPALAVAALLSACGSSSGSTNHAASSGQPASSSAGSTTVESASNSSLGGTVLVDAKGLTLYSLSGERAGKFICTGNACVQTWHPLTVSSGAKPSGSVNSLGVVKRPDGTEQVTYKGMPLYTFAQDQPGQANGQGIKDVGVWKAVETSATTGAASSSTGASGASGTPASSGGGSSYTY